MSAVILLLQIAAAATSTSIRYERLENGLRVCIFEEHSQPLVSAQLWIAAGSALDPPDRVGLCHIARALLEPEPGAPPDALNAESRTLRDACFFAAVARTAPAASAPADEIPLDGLLARHARRLAQPSVSESAVAAAIARADTSAAANIAAVDGIDAARIDAWQALLERAFAAAGAAHHPYSRPPGAMGPWTRNADPREVEEFLRRWFVPANATLVVIGDVSAVSVLDQIRDRFGALPRADPPRRPEIPFFRDPPLVAVNDGVGGAAMAWFTPPAGDFQNAAFDVLVRRALNPVDGVNRQRPIDGSPGGARFLRLGWREMGLCVLTLRPSESPAEARARLDQFLTRLDAALSSAEGSEISLNRARALAFRAALERRMGFAARARLLGEAQVVAGDFLADEYERGAVARVDSAALNDALAELKRAAAAGVEESQSIRGAAELPGSGAPVSAESLQLERRPCVRRSGGRVECSFTPIPGELLAAVRVRCPRWTDSATLRNGVERGAAGWDAARLADYLSYHGLTLRVADAADGPGILIDGAPRELAQMIELAGQLAKELAPADAPLLLLVIADAEAVAVFKLVFGDDSGAGGFFLPCQAGDASR
ncbi:Peptidase M16 inactive domain protein [Phycisphaerae bacterium RAS1]|nr:Peptidase M16 inactive domain protein [Phycisphaerae bacterium RAS1]